MFSLAGKRVILTGASGFVGRHLLARLEQLGATVVTPPRTDDFNLIDEDCFRERVDYVFHLAGRIGVVDSWQQPIDFLEVNALGTARVLERCRKWGCAMTMVSAYIYGVPERLPISETHPIAPNNPYAFSKRLAEQICVFYAQFFGVKIVTLRLFNIYGPRQSTNFLIPRIVSQTIDPDCAEIVVQDLSPRRDYLFITDAVEAIVASIRAQPGTIFNVGSGFSHSVEEVIKAAEAAAGVAKPYRESGIRRAHDIEDVVADISAIERELGWRPRVSLDHGLRAIMTSMLSDTAD